MAAAKEHDNAENIGKRRRVLSLHTKNIYARTRSSMNDVTA